MDFKQPEHWAITTVNRPWFSLILLICITALAAGLRIFKLGEWSFWIDEIFTINRAMTQYSNFESIVLNLPPNAIWVPISVLLSSPVLQTFGINEWSARLAPALIGIMSIPILYFPIKNILDKWTALIAVSLLAVSPWHIFWSQNARFYTSILLIYTLALFIFYLGFEKDRARYIAIGFLLFYLAMSERIIAIFIVPVVVSYLMILWLIPSIRPKGFNRKNLLIISIPVVLGLFVFVISYLFTGSVPFFLILIGFSSM
jgi:mannosyltransferase